MPTRKPNPQDSNHENNRRLCKEAIDKWRQKNFFTEEEHKIVYRVLQELLTEKKFHTGDLWIIDLALLAAEMKRRRPHPPETTESLGAELGKVSAAIEAIKNSQVSFVLNPGADQVLSLTKQQLPTDSSIVERLVRPRLESNNPEYLIPGLIALDLCPATKPTNYTESFFALVLSTWFKKTNRNPRWKLIAKSITMCFGGGKMGRAQDKRGGKAITWNAKNLEEACRKFTDKFPTGPAAAEAVHVKAMNVRITGLPA